MTNIADIFIGSDDEWLEALSRYEQSLIGSIGLADPMSAAAAWLGAQGWDSTAVHGAQPNPSATPFIERLQDELWKFLCGGPEYEADRKALVAEAGKGKAYIVGALSAFVAPSIGVAGVFIAPALVLIAIAIGRMGLNAWCAGRRPPEGGGQ